MKIKNTYNAELYLGSINEKTGKQFSYENLVREIGIFQEECTKMVPVCVSEVEFISGIEYREKGWRVSVINYPKIDLTPKDIDRFMINLAEVLVFALHQKRITVIGSKQPVMIENL